MIPVALPRQTRRKTTPYFQCVTCHQLFRVRHGCKRSCVDCEDLRLKAKEAAQNALQREYKAGRMLRAKHYKCRDCGAQAEVYDHRDYSKPLDVEPVCRSCNAHRGPAAL